MNLNPGRYPCRGFETKNVSFDRLPNGWNQVGPEAGLGHIARRTGGKDSGDEVLVRLVGNTILVRQPPTRNRGAAFRPSRTGMEMSMTSTSGSSLRTSSTASWPLFAVPATSNSSASNQCVHACNCTIAREDRLRHGL